MENNNKLGSSDLANLSTIISEYEDVNQNAADLGHGDMDEVRKQVNMAMDTITFLTKRASLIRTNMEDHIASLKKDIEAEIDTVNETGVIEDEACNWGNHIAHMEHLKHCEAVAIFFKNIDINQQ
tara:strand:- start:270 stop:644 length:375 start_codon:yes stop_codon:yes gene_type:complete